MPNIFFISDTHFGHDNILNFKREDGTPLRTFTSGLEMDEHMVERWNAVVRPQDHIYHLGDVSMKRPKYVAGLLGRLNGHKRLVRGNHDIYRTKEYIEVGFEEIYGVRVIDGLLMTHIPVHPQSLGRFVANVHGHIHDRVVMKAASVWAGEQPDPRYINIAVEQIDYTPVSLEWLKLRCRTLAPAIVLG